MLHPLQPIGRGVYLGYTGITIFIPCCVEYILLLRILAVYPYNQTPKRQFFMIIAFPVTMKIARIINASIYLAKFNALIRDSPIGVGAVALEAVPNAEIEWFLSVFDNL